jgi:hypothetical protein
VAVKDAQGHIRSAENLFVDVTRSLASMGEGTTMTALAMRVFGKSGADMIPFIKAFGGDIDKAKAKAAELGILVSTDMAKRADQWNDSMETMGAWVRGLGNDVAWATMVIIDYIKNIKGLTGIEAAAGAEHTALEEAAVKATAAANTKKAEAILLGEKATNAAAEEAKRSAKAVQEIIAGLRQHLMVSDQDADGLVRWKLAAEKASPAARQYAENLMLLARLMKGQGGSVAGMTELPKLASALREFGGEGRAVFEATRLPVEKLAGELIKLDELLASGAINMDTYARATQQAKKQSGLLADTMGAIAGPLTELQRGMQEFGRRTGEAFRTAMLHGRGFGDVLKSLLVDLSQLLLKMAFGASIKGMATTGASGFFRSLFGGLIGMAPGFAGGGDFMAGQAIRVGEQGPELAVFNRPGTIIPNGASAARGGIVQNIHIDARGADIGVYHRLNMLFMKQAFRDYTLALADHARRGI